MKREPSSVQRTPVETDLQRAEQDRSLAPEDLFKLRFLHDSRLSPNGRTLACLVSRTDEAAGKEYIELVVNDINADTPHVVAFEGSPSLPRWSPSGETLAFIGRTNQTSRLYAYSTRTRLIESLTSTDDDIQGTFNWSPDGRSIACVSSSCASTDKNGRIVVKDFRSEGAGLVQAATYSILLVDVEHGSTRVVETGLPVALQPAFCPFGKRILFVGSDQAVAYSVSFMKDVGLYLLDIEKGTVDAILKDEKWSISGAAWSPAGDRIVFAGAYDSPLPVPVTGLWTVTLADKSVECRTEGRIGNVGLRVHHDMPTWNTQNNIFAVPVADHAYATVQTHGRAEIWRISLSGPVSCETICTGERSCLIMDVDPVSDCLLYAVSDFATPWELYRADLMGAGEERLSRLNDAVLADWPEIEVEHLQFESYDGLALEGWHLSNRRDGSPAPTVMFIHGGPYHGTGHAFRFDFHLLASHGFAILTGNFRGSTGYGERFAQAIMGDWGGRGFGDHMALADAAVASGLADPARLGVWGHSHGGFASAWIVGHTDRFRAAIVEAGATNFATLYYLSDAPHLFAKDLGGRPDEIPDIYRAHSPLTYAHRARTPTLLLHGEEDLRCPIAEAEQFYRVLQDVGCTTEMVRVAGMNHMGDSTGPLAARKAQNLALVDWFERFL